MTLVILDQCIDGLPLRASLDFTLIDKFLQENLESYITVSKSYRMRNRDRAYLEPLSSSSPSYSSPLVSSPSVPRKRVGYPEWELPYLRIGLLMFRFEYHRMRGAPCRQYVDLNKSTRLPMLLECVVRLSWYETKNEKGNKSCRGWVILQAISCLFQLGDMFFKNRPPPAAAR